ncbi:DnaJ domain-containing protein [Patescibacteria group bacterium]|nr:DnaJ domain-containing protein [Patescibacteria group bacterium]
MKDPWKVLGLDKATATERDVRSAWRALAPTVHPDAGGDPEAFRALSSAYRAALDYARQPRRCPTCKGRGWVSRRGASFAGSKTACTECAGKGVK